MEKSKITTLLATRAAVLKVGHVSIRNSDGFTIDKVSGTIKTTMAMEIAPFQTVIIQRLSKGKGH